MKIIKLKIIKTIEINKINNLIKINKKNRN